MVALDRKTGDVLWQVDNCLTKEATPVVARLGEREFVIVNGTT